MCGLMRSGPEFIKLFFVLNSAEQDVCPANKSQIINTCIFFLAVQLSMKISLLINMKMPTMKISLLINMKMPAMEISLLINLKMPTNYCWHF